MPITSQPTAVQPTLLNSPAKAYELAFMIKESECADACVSSSKRDRKRNRPSDTGITECACWTSMCPGITAWLGVDPGQYLCRRLAGLHVQDGVMPCSNSFGTMFEA